MPIALTNDQNELAESVAKFVSRVAPVRESRERFVELSAGVVPEFWTQLVDMGLHAIHIPEEIGGQGGKFEDLAVVVEETGYGLLPGPFLPTVIASSLLIDAQGMARDTALAKFANGSTGVVIPPSGGIQAKANSDGTWVLNGQGHPIIGLLSAEILVIAAQLNDRYKWFVVDSSLSGLTKTALRATDLTRDAGSLVVEGLVLDTSLHLASLDRSRAAAITTTLLAAESAGIMRWALETSVAYAKVRTQFDKPIGSFQAVKHKCARLMVKSELAAAAAWDAAISLEQDSEQQLRATSTASVVALGEVVDAVTEGVSLHGGIGFTWEHDLHLYLRRGISIAAANGPKIIAAQALGKLALNVNRQIDVDLPEEDPGFRAMVGAILDEALQLSPVDPDTPEKTTGMTRGISRSPRRTFLAQHGLISSHWPKPWGMAATPTEQVVISQEYSQRQMHQPTTVIGEWALPTIFAHGSAYQQEKFALPSLRGEIIWCQLFSEPGAGSDLAGLSTKATKVDGGWQIDGQKVWTSSAHEADWGICLVRTDKDVPKHKGLSYFLVDMKSPGVNVRPLKLSNETHELNEVFLDAVFVPDDLLVGEPGDGWKLATTTLSNERTSIAGSLGTEYENSLVELLRSGVYATSRDFVEQTLGRITAQSEAIGALNLRETLKRLNGLNPGAGGSIAKVAAAALSRESAEAALNIVGNAGISSISPANVVNEELGLPSSIIGGGTIDIQYNIIAERILQLPR